MRWLVLLSGLLVLGLGGVIVWWPGNENPSRSCVLADADIGEFVNVPGGGFVKGADAVYPEEGGPIKLHVSPFLLSITEVTNDQFAAFVDATGYVTEAERNGGSAGFVETDTPSDLLSWWRLDKGATWRTPGGAGSDIARLGRHPVVHVSLADARAYADWAGGRLPNEVEWEYAASLGLFDPDDPESGLRGPDGEIRANTWNGVFPVLNTAEDGFAGAAPVGCYRASLIGVHDMIGNVWEWTETPFGDGSPQFTIKGRVIPVRLELLSPLPRSRPPKSLEADFSTAHTGFRIVKDPG